MSPPLKNILVIRNDKIGDFMLAWPAFAMLKTQYPNVAITALVPEYTKPLADLCPWIDTTIIDKRSEHALSDIKQLAGLIKTGQFDASISLFSELRTAAALWLADIQCRVGPATKLAQVFLNCRLKQKRSRSAKPEFEYNVDLARYFIKLNHDSPEAQPASPFLVFNKNEIHNIRNDYCINQEINEPLKLIIIHPGTGGSAINLDLQLYARLLKKLASLCETHIIITAGPGELEIAENLAKLLKDDCCSIYQSSDGIVDFCKFINIADLFISGSTGPLHIAGALNIKTAAFYPSRRSATALRWQTLNDEPNRLAFTLPDSDAELDIDRCADEINNHLLKC